MASHGKQSETSSSGESGWKNRIVSYGIKNADQFAPHPKNARLHPEMQRQAMEASLDTLGWIAPVIESKSGYLIDGHERVWQALKNNAPVPFVIVDLNEDEENQALLTYDYIGQMAVYDQQQTETLLQAVNSDNAAIQAMLTQLGVDVGVIPPDNPYDEWQGMPEFDPEPLAFRSIHVHFKTQSDIDDFARLIGQNITDATRSLWHPYQEKRDLKSTGYVSDES